MPDGEGSSAGGGGGGGFKMGDAYVDIHADGTKAAKKAAADLRAARKDIDDAAKDIGDSAGKKAGDKLGESTAKATKQRVSKEAPGLSKWIALSVFGGLPAAAAAAGGAAAASIGGIGVAVIGTAALITSSNQAAQASYNRLFDTIVTGAKTAADPLADSLGDAADQMNRDVTMMGGSFQRLFASVEPGIDDLADGLTGLVRESLPGMIKAGEQSEVVFQGVASAAKSTGKGVSEFFTNTAQSAQASNAILQSFGRIVQNALGFAGAFITQLANNGSSSVVRFEQVLHQTESTVLSLGRGAFPVAFTAARELMNVFSGLLSVVGQFSPVLGPATGAVLAFVAAGKAMNLLTFGRLGAELANVKTQFRDADGFRNKFSVGLGALGGGFGLAGAAAIGVTTVLGILGQSQADAAKKTQQHQQRVDALTQALIKSNGVVDASVRASAAQALADTKLKDMKVGVLQMTRELGLSIPQVTDAYLGNAAAQAEVTAQLDAMIPKGLEWERVAKNGTEEERKRIGWAALLKNAFADTNSELGIAIGKYRDIATAAGTGAKGVDDLRGAEDRAKKASADLRGAFQTLADPMGDVATRGKAIADALDRLSGRQPELEESTKAWAEFMDNLKGMDWESPAAGSKKWGDALVDTSGKINTTTKDGRALFDAVNAGRTSFFEVASGMVKAGESSAAVTAKLTEMRAGFVETLVKMGVSKTEAEALANAYGLIPSNVSTLVSTGGTVSATTAEVLILGGKLRGLPPNTPVKVDALTDEARRLLESMGVQIRSLPNGKFEVVAQSAAAAKNLEDFIAYWQRRQIGIPVVVTTPKSIPVRTATGHGSVFFAEGTDFAPGGPAIVGEEGPELVNLPRGSQVIPADKTRNIMSAAQHASGGHDGASLPTPTAAAGSTVTVNNYWTLPALPFGGDVNALVELVSRRFEQRLRQSWGG